MIDDIEIRHGSRQGSPDDTGILGYTTSPIFSDLEMHTSSVIFGYQDTLMKVSSLLGYPFQQSCMRPQGVVAAGSVSLLDPSDQLDIALPLHPRGRELMLR